MYLFFIEKDTSLMTKLALFTQGCVHWCTSVNTSANTFHCENGLDTSILSKSKSKNTSTSINFFSFSCACTYACICTPTSENKIPLRHNTSTWIYLPHVVKFGQENTGSRLPQTKQLGWLLVLVFASNFVSTWVIPNACICACACDCACSCIACENHPSQVVHQYCY